MPRVQVLLLFPRSQLFLKRFAVEALPGCGCSGVELVFAFTRMTEDIPWFFRFWRFELSCAGELKRKNTDCHSSPAT